MKINPFASFNNLSVPARNLVRLIAACHRLYRAPGGLIAVPIEAWHTWQQVGRLTAESEALFFKALAELQSTSLFPDDSYRWVKHSEVCNAIVKIEPAPPLFGYLPHYDEPPEKSAARPPAAPKPKGAQPEPPAPEPEPESEPEKDPEPVSTQRKPGEMPEGMKLALKMVNLENGRRLLAQRGMVRNARGEIQKPKPKPEIPSVASMPEALGMRITEDWKPTLDLAPFFTAVGLSEEFWPSDAQRLAFVVAMRRKGKALSNVGFHKAFAEFCKKTEGEEL